MRFNTWHALEARAQSAAAFAAAHGIPYVWLHRLVYRMPAGTRRIDAALLVRLGDALQYPVEALGRPRRVP